VGRHAQNAKLCAFAPLAENRFLTAVGDYQVEQTNCIELQRIDNAGRTLGRQERAGSQPLCLIPMRNRNLLVVCGRPSLGWRDEDYWASELDPEGRLVWEALSPFKDRESSFLGVQVPYPLVRVGFTRTNSPLMDVERPDNRLGQLSSKSLLVRKHAAI